MSDHVSVPFELIGNSIMIPVSINGVETVAVLDTGDAIGPVVNTADEMACKVARGAPLGITGAGGAATVYSARMTVGIGDVVLHNEEGAIDEMLDGPSLIGLPFFMDKCHAVWLNLRDSKLVLRLKPEVMARLASGG